MAQQVLKIAELGFGTGLNFLETWRQGRPFGGQDVLTFESPEAFPLNKAEMAKALSAWETLEKETYIQLTLMPEIWPPHGEALQLELDPQTQLIIHFGLAEDVIDDCGRTRGVVFRRICPRP